MVKPFAAAHFAIAHQKDIFPENFFMSKSTLATVGFQLISTFPRLCKENSEIHSYSTLLKKIRKALTFDFFYVKA